ncbi:MAG: phosphoglycerate dehydrogenase [Acidobacteriia bacterium]|nr:phosphoglycerate dehydrogenase [Terriglobia bacterium]
MADRRPRVLITTVPFGQPRRDALDRLEAEGLDYVINPIGRRLREQELVDLIGDVDLMIAGTEPITARVIAAASRLRLISRVGIGLDSVDLLAARARGIPVSYTPDAPAPAVAELTLGLMLALLRHIAPADRQLRQGRWQRYMGRRLDGLTVGLVGAGRVGRRVATMIRAAFPSTTILAHDLAPDTAFGRATGVRWVDRDTLFAGADIVSLHVPLTPQTRGLVGARDIALMKPTAFLINTARGTIVDEHALAAALRAGRLQGAALDVFEDEPYAGELASLDNVLLTCHMGSMSEDCRAAMEYEATDEVIRCARGEPLIRLVPEDEYALAELRQAAS